MVQRVSAQQCEMWSVPQIEEWLENPVQLMQEEHTQGYRVCRDARKDSPEYLVGYFCVDNGGHLAFTKHQR